MPAPHSHILRQWCLLLLLVAGSRQLSITEFVVPTSVAVSSDAELQCSFSEAESVDYVKWWWTPVYVPSDDSNRILIYQQITGQETPDIPRKNTEYKGNHTIVLLDLKPSDSGVYECEVSDVTGENEDRKHENLTVFFNGTYHQLNVNNGPDDTVLVLCEALNVTPEPELTITVDGTKIPAARENITDGVVGLYNVSVEATVRSDKLGDSEIRCELTYIDKNIIHPPYVQTYKYTSGAGLSTTETPEDTTHSEVASELQNKNGVSELRASFWVLHTVAVLILYVLP